MLYRICDGSVSVGGNLVLSHFDFEIKGKEKVGVVGRNGAGKTTFLRLLSGELKLDRDDKRDGPGVELSEKITIGMLGQQAFSDDSRTVEELLSCCPAENAYDQERFAYEWEYDVLFTRFGFSKEDKKRKLSEFSGGEQTRIALIGLLLQKPDLLLLDEPTNHLDTEMTEWLERYLREYEHAVVVVSHDRFFLDQVAETVWELEEKKMVRYAGNYSYYRLEKRKRMAMQQKQWERQQQEEARLGQVIERFKHKPAKASFARAKKKQLERMEKVKPPIKEDIHLFTGNIDPAVLGGKLVFEAEHLKIGYDSPILELSLRIRRGQKLGLLGPNGAGKSTFLKTVAGYLPALEGKGNLGRHVTIGYFDQNAANIRSEKSVLEHFHEQFPALTEKEARSVLGAYLFGGREAAKRVKDLSGGEKARLVLAELLQARPNFLILDEPTNHMDIPAKETLESAFQAYKGTILFVSHDRYFIRQVAQSLLIFEDKRAFYHPFGYEHYLEKVQRRKEGRDFSRQALSSGIFGEGDGSVAYRMTAEDQALVESLRSVPRAERHRLREPETEEMYEDWRLAPVRERMEAAAAEYEQKRRQAKEMLFKWQETEEFWEEVRGGAVSRENGEGDDGENGVGNDGENGGQNGRGNDEKQEKYKNLIREAQEAWEKWNEACLEWMEMALED